MLIVIIHTIKMSKKQALEMAMAVNIGQENEPEFIADYYETSDTLWIG